MKPLWIVALALAILTNPPAFAAEKLKTITANVEGALVTFPNSPVQMELGRGISGINATQREDGTIIINMVAATNLDGFIIRNAKLIDLKVEYTPDGEALPSEIVASTKAANDVYSYLPLAGTQKGGKYTIIIADQPEIEKKRKKAFLN